jgi:hypothetical protein
MLVGFGGEAFEVLGAPQPPAGRTSQQCRGDFSAAERARYNCSRGFYAGAPAAETWCGPETRSSVRRLSFHASYSAKPMIRMLMRF